MFLTSNAAQKYINQLKMVLSMYYILYVEIIIVMGHILISIIYFRITTFLFHY